jgi:hypothetical protein
MQYGFWKLFQSVTNFRLVCLLPIVAYAYILFFLTHVLGDMKNLKKMACFYQYYTYIYIYGLFNTTEIQYKLFPTLICPENIWVWERDTWNYSQFLFNNIQLYVLTMIINESSYMKFIFTLLTVSR